MHIYTAHVRESENYSKDMSVQEKVSEKRKENRKKQKHGLWGENKLKAVGCRWSFFEDGLQPWRYTCGHVVIIWRRRMFVLAQKKGRCIFTPPFACTSSPLPYWFYYPFQYQSNSIIGILWKLKGKRSAFNYWYSLIYMEYWLTFRAGRRSYIYIYKYN